MSIGGIQRRVHFRFTGRSSRRESSEFVMFIGLDLRLVKNKNAFLAYLKLRSFVPAHIRACLYESDPRQSPPAATSDRARSQASWARSPRECLERARAEW